MRGNKPLANRYGNAKIATRDDTAGKAKCLRMYPTRMLLMPSW